MNWKTERLDEGHKSSLVLYRRVYSEVPGSATGWERVAYEAEFDQIKHAMENPTLKKEAPCLPPTQL